ncbi:MAG: DUF4369 domain-containing protein [Prevotella sp.]
MNKTISVLCAVVALCCSCAETFKVQGTSSLSQLDGNKLYLKTIKDNELKSIDSCDVLHGQFSFIGTLDTVRMANLFMDEQSVLPVVLESGVINIKIDQANQVVSGTPLNEKLYAFLDKHKQLDSRMNELNHRQSQMMLDGIDEETIKNQLSAEAEQIIKEEDRLVTDFIVNNFDNVLGPGVFMMITSAFQYPVLTPQIEDIMSKATEKFKNDPYVKDYYKTATENEAKLQGLDENNH